MQYSAVKERLKHTTQVRKRDTVISTLKVKFQEMYGILLAARYTTK